MYLPETGPKRPKNITVSTQINSTNCCKVYFDVSSFEFTICLVLTSCPDWPIRSTLELSSINLLKPAGHVMHQQFNIQQLYVLPTLYLCVLYLSENKQRLLPFTS